MTTASTPLVPDRALPREGSPRPLGKRLRDDVVHALVAALVAAATLAPRRVLDAFGWLLGGLAYVLLPSARRRVRARLFQGLGTDPLEPRVRSAFLTAGATLADTLALFKPSERAGETLRLDPASKEVFRAALAEGRGVVFIAAHVGSWERMAALLVEEGFPVAAVARQAVDVRVTRLYERIRAPRGVRSLYRGQLGAAVAIAGELRGGRAVGFLVDLPARVRSAEAVLFGAPTSLPVGAARIALTQRAAVVVGVAEPRAARRGACATVHIDRIATGDVTAGPAGVATLMQRMARALDGFIASHPEGWLGLFVDPSPARARDGNPASSRAR